MKKCKGVMANSPEAVDLGRKHAEQLAKLPVFDALGMLVEEQHACGKDLGTMIGALRVLERALTLKATLQIEGQRERAFLRMDRAAILAGVDAAGQMEIGGAGHV